MMKLFGVALILCAFILQANAYVQTRIASLVKGVQKGKKTNSHSILAVSQYYDCSLF